MIATDENNNDYQVYPESAWPKTGYKYNATLSNCIDNKGEGKPNIISYDIRKREATVITKNATFCYLYFDVDLTPPEFDTSAGGGGFQIINGDKCVMIGKKCSSQVGVKTTIRWKSDDVEAYCVSNSSNPDDCTEDDWKEVTDGMFSVTVNHNLQSGDGDKIVYAHIMDTAGNISTKSDDIILDTTRPTVSIKAFRQDNNSSVSSGVWYNSRLKYVITETLSGPSGYKIYYCEGANNCDPTNVISSGTNRNSSTTGSYYVRYKIVSNAGLESSIGSFNGNVDLTKPTVLVSSFNQTTGAVVYTCNDTGGSGVKSGYPNPSSKNLTGTYQSYSVTCVDNAGNEQTLPETYTYSTGGVCGYNYKSCYTSACGSYECGRQYTSFKKVWTDENGNGVECDWHNYQADPMYCYYYGYPDGSTKVHKVSNCYTGSCPNPPEHYCNRRCENPACGTSTAKSCWHK